MVCAFSSAPRVRARWMFSTLEKLGELASVASLVESSVLAAEYTAEDYGFYACHCGSAKCRGTIVKTRKKIRK